MNLTKGILIGLAISFGSVAHVSAQSPVHSEQSDLIADVRHGEFWEPTDMYSFLTYKEPDFVADMIGYAKTFIGTRYRRGGMTPKGFDCSGFTGYVFDQFGYKLNRTSRDQYEQGEAVDLKDLRPGDLMFFGGRRNGKGSVGHVGIVVSVDSKTNAVKFIHSSTSAGVRIDSYPDGGYYSKRYIGARRIVE